MTISLIEEKLQHLTLFLLEALSLNEIIAGYFFVGGELRYNRSCVERKGFTLFCCGSVMSQYNQHAPRRQTSC